MEDVKLARAPAARIVSAARVAGALAARAFLRWGEGRPRGFWARGGRWVAHVGEAARLGVEGEGAARFRWIREEGGRLLAGAWEGESGGEPVAPRLFGGFSFRDDHEPTGLWEAFPAGLFLLPEVELVGGHGGEAVLVGRRLLDEADDPEEARRALGEELEALAAEVRGAGTEAGRETGVEILSTASDTDRAEWGQAVEEALEAIRRGEVSKVVLARALEVELATAPDLPSLVGRLWQENPGAHVFLLEPEPGHVLLGAAPETIATVTQGVFHATAVAGSVPRGEGPVEQRELSRRLLRSGKDRAEHAFCVEDMVERLGPRARSVRHQREPHVLSLARIQHLEASIEATLREGETVLSVLEALHPTPAVCGLPRDAALAFLAREEPVQRGWYAGPVGWFDASGQGIFVPALRMGVGRGTHWRLYAGAGIVEGSDPEAEWAETGLKLEPVLRALGGEDRGTEAS